MSEKTMLKTTERRKQVAEMMKGTNLKSIVIGRNY